MAAQALATACLECTDTSVVAPLCDDGDDLHQFFVALHDGIDSVDVCKWPNVMDGVVDVVRRHNCDTTDAAVVILCYMPIVSNTTARCVADVVIRQLQQGTCDVEHLNDMFQMQGHAIRQKFGPEAHCETLLLLVYMARIYDRHNTLWSRLAVRVLLHPGITTDDMRHRLFTEWFVDDCLPSVSVHLLVDTLDAAVTSSPYDADHEIVMHNANTLVDLISSCTHVVNTQREAVERQPVHWLFRLYANDPRLATRVIEMFTSHTPTSAQHM